MANELAVRQPDAIAPVDGFGNNVDVEGIRSRMIAMVPGAVECPPDVVLAAAQLAVMHRLNPFNGEIMIIKLGRKKNAAGQWVDDYRAHIGIKGLRKKAREQAQYMTDVRDLSPAEVQALRRDQYDADDIGVEVAVYRMDLVHQCKALGIQYRPFRATGFWRKKAQAIDVYENNKSTGKKEWKSDPIPNTWTARDVAEKRAEVSALKKAFDLNIEVVDPSIEGEHEDVRILSAEIAQHDRDNAGFLEARPYTEEEDGDVLWAKDRDYAAAAQNKALPLPAGAPAPRNGNGHSNGHGNGNGNAQQPPADEWSGWTTPADAYAWAVEVGACANEFEARNSMQKIVDAQFGGKVTKLTARNVYAAFVARQKAKLEERAQRAQDEAEITAGAAELAAVTVDGAVELAH